MHFEVLKFFGLKLPNSSRKPIKKFLHFKILTLQNVKFEMSEYSNHVQELQLKQTYNFSSLSIVIWFH